MRKRTRLQSIISVLLCIVTIIGICPIAATADTTATSAQIGNHYAVIETTGTNGKKQGTLATSATVTGDTSITYEDGMLVTNKTITAGANENEFEITLEVQTQAKIEHIKYDEDAAAVIVIDTSGSMKEDGVEWFNYNNRLSKAKKAAEAFIKKFAATTGSNVKRKIAVVGFSDSARTYNGGWFDASNSFSSENSLENMTASGATNLEAGLLLAEYMLKLDDVNDIANKNIIVLTDGEPTYYLISNKYKFEKINSSDYQITGKNNRDQYYGGGGNYTDHTTHTQTEATAKKIINNDIDIYGIYVGNENVVCREGSSNCALAQKQNNKPNQGSSGKSAGTWLRENCGMIAYALSSWSSDSNLNSLFETIVDEIEYRAKAWQATDPIGAMFDFDGFVTTHIDSENNDFYITENTIKWDLRLVNPVSQTTNNGVTTSTYQLKYKVKLNTLKSGYEAGKYYPTNGVTSVNYRIERAKTSGNDAGTSEIKKDIAYFNVPSAKGYAAGVSFNKTDDKGDTLAGATFELKTGSWSMTATSDENGKVEFKDVPSGHTYTLTEISAPTGYDKDSTTRTVTVSYGNISGNIAANGSTEIQNTLQTGSLKITKTVVGTETGNGIYSFNVKLDKAATCTVTYSSGTTGSYTITGTGSGIHLKNGQSVTISGIPVGYTYTVTETKDTERTYTTSATNGTTTVSGASDKGTEISGTIVKDQTTTVAFTNTYSKPEPEKTSVKVTKVWDDANNQDGKRPANVTVFLCANGEYLKAAVLDASNSWTNTFTGLDKTDSDGKTIKYTVSEQNVTTGYTAAYSGTAATGYTITNSHTPETITLSGTKTWSGDVATDRPSSITVRLWADGAEKDHKTVSEASDGSWTYSFTNLPKYKDGKEIVYTITEETVTGYTTTIDGYDIINTKITPDTIKYQFNIKKTVAKGGNVAPSGEKTFTFVISTSQDKSDKEAVLKTVTLTVDGVGSTVTTEMVTVSTTATTIYVWEQAGSGEGWNYDNTVYKIWKKKSESIYIDTVSPDGVQTIANVDLKDPIHFLDNFGNFPSFTNTYTKNEVVPQTGSLTISKTVVGTETNEKFEFEIMAYQGTGITMLNGTYKTNTETTVEFVSGYATVYLAHGESITIQDLPAGATYSVTEQNIPTNYTKTSTGATGTITAGGTAVAVFTNTYKVPETDPEPEVTGSLTVSKAVSGSGASKSQYFTFTVTARGLKDGKYGNMTFKNGVATFALKDGESIKATGLPLGTVFYVTESDNDGYTVKINGFESAKFEGTIEKETLNVTVAFENYKASMPTPIIFPGNLTVTKTVMGNGDYSKAFTFTVTASSQGAPLVGTYGGMTFVNGVATFTLKHGESKNAIGLPAGTVYTVVEAQDADYLTSAVGASGIIATGTTSYASFTNTFIEKTVEETGSLTVTKSVTGTGADKSEYFTFTVHATLDKTPLVGTYGKATFGRDGNYTFLLKHGESMTIYGLPIGTVYTVTEANVNGYEVTANGYAVGQVDGSITDTTPAIAAFVNHKDKPIEYGSIEITKTVKGNKAPTTGIDYTFIVWVRSEDGTVISENVSYKRNAADTSQTESGNLTIPVDGYTFTLKDGESLTLTGVISGTRVEVHEISTGAFTTTTNGLVDDICVIATDTVKHVEVINDYGNAETTTETTGGETTPTTPADPNRPLDDVPQTGSERNGIRFELILAGLALFGMAALTVGKAVIRTRRSR